MSWCPSWLALAAALAASVPAVAEPDPAKPIPAGPAPARPDASQQTVKGVTVTGEPPPVRTSIDRRSYSVSGDLQATTGSISDALRNVPSVEVDVNGNVSLRGDPNVTIMVDGKPSGMFRGEGKAQALQSLPADQIERVEVITNPSAAFSPEGSAGIINLVMKKTDKPGLSGGARANLGSSGRQNGGANVTYKDGRFTWSGSAYGRHDSLKQVSAMTKSFVASGAGQPTDEARDNIGSGDVRLANLRGGVDYDPDAKTRFSAEVNYRSLTYDSLSALAVRQATAAGDVVLADDTANALREDRDTLETTLGYRRKMGEDHEVSLSFVRELNDDDRSRVALRHVRIPAAAGAYEDTEQRDHAWRTQLKADYSRPLAGGVKLKLGYEFDGDDNDYRVVFGRGPEGGPAAIDPGRSNLFKFDQQVHAAYATYERPFGRLTTLAGLRAEVTRIDLNQVTDGLKQGDDDVRLYPSLHLSWRLDEGRQFKASYSRRVQRPNPQDYNPFRIYYDPQTFRAGNPDLKPQTTDSFELGYEQRQRGTMYLATLYYRSGRDAVNDVTRDLGGGVLLQTRENVGSFQAAGLELTANGRLPGRLTYSLSGNALWSEIDAGDLGFGSTRRSGASVFGRATLNWQATARDFLQVQGIVNGRRLTPQGHIEPIGFVNLGYRHKFNDRISGVVTVQDAFASFRFRSVIDTPLLRQTVRGDPQNRAVFVGLSYTFGGGRPRDPGFDYGQGGAAPGN
ncbi:TonB-dependent receptor [Phenylobacterium sp.]|uniref:TonB-dependent receptor domain-containing protein n=1 Tax=Phenylobacterium sp. TaxID=1871053 RepID=UPI0025E1A979|nr:TonB-dependent receptor [Phenylobacterium sp.]